MKVVILSKGRPDTISTHKLFRDYVLVLHTEEERQEYLKNPSISPEKVIVSNVPFGVANQRQWIQDFLIPENEWYISLDDNIQAFQAVPEPDYFLSSLPVKTDKRMKALYDAQCSGDRFIKICEEMAKEGERIKAYNIGFGTTPNYFFRDKKFREVGYVISKAVVRKNLRTPFALDAQAMEDYAFTAENLLKYGKVLINNFVFPVAGHYEKGGIGTYTDRLPKKIAAGEILMKRYPGLFRHPNKKGTEPKGELAIRFTSTKQVEAWRTFMRINKFHGQAQTEYQTY